jgi:hypothetical protein
MYIGPYYRLDWQFKVAGWGQAVEADREMVHSQAEFEFSAPGRHERTYAPYMAPGSRSFPEDFAFPTLRKHR